MTTKKEDIVISGIGGVFPESNNVEELKELLFSKANGVTIDSRKWIQSTYRITFISTVMFYLLIFNLLNVF